MLLGGKNSTNILDLSNVNSRHYALYLDNVSSFDKTRYVRDYLIHIQPVSEEKQMSVCGINHLVISANATIEGQEDGYTFYVKPNTGYSMINVSSRYVIFPETALLCSGYHVTYFPEQNILSLKMRAIQGNTFQLDVANYLKNNKRITSITSNCLISMVL